MLTTILTALLQTASPAASPTPTLASEAERLGTTRIKLGDALTSRERSRRFRPSARRYCVRDEITAPSRSRLVCRPLEDWHMLGFELADEAPR